MLYKFFFKKNRKIEKIFNLFICAFSNETSIIKVYHEIISSISPVAFSCILFIQISVSPSSHGIYLYFLFKLRVTSKPNNWQETQKTHNYKQFPLHFQLYAFKIKHLSGAIRNQKPTWLQSWLKLVRTCYHQQRH